MSTQFEREWAGIRIGDAFQIKGSGSVLMRLDVGDTVVDLRYGRTGACTEYLRKGKPIAEQIERVHLLVIRGSFEAIPSLEGHS